MQRRKMRETGVLDVGRATYQDTRDARQKAELRLHRTYLAN